MVPLVMVIALLLRLTVGIVEINVVQLVQNNVGHGGEKKSVFVSNAISVTNIDQKFEFSNAITKLFARMLYVINAVSVRDH